jgi:Domain of unknown function (DUF1877)
MSMMARFVAITPDQFATIKDKPEMVGGVFALDAGRPLESPSDLQDRLRRQAPHFVANMLERLPPAVRQQLRQKLGLGEEGLPNSGNNNQLMLQLAQREAARRRARPLPGAPGHSISLDKAWHGLHYLSCGVLEPGPGPLGQAVFCGCAIGEDRATGRHAISPRRKSPRSQRLSNRRAWNANWRDASMERR